MTSNYSSLPDSLCFEIFSQTGKTNLVYHLITLAICVVIAVLAPMAVVANGFILAAIWKNASLRTPSYVLLAELALTDWFTGLLTEPAFLVDKVAVLTGNIRIRCTSNPAVFGLGYYFPSLTGFFITLSALERWLHMSRRSLVTVRRIIILSITGALLLIIMETGCIYVWYYRNNYWNELYTKIEYLYASVSALHVGATSFAYFKVFQIIRYHQGRVQTNESNFNMRKYKRSIFNILYILAIFILGYVPFLCCTIAFHVLPEYRKVYGDLAINVSAALLFSTSVLNPLLYYWRIQDVREGVRGIIRALFCKHNGEET